jgi:hypothetical protein
MACHLRQAQGQGETDTVIALYAIRARDCVAKLTHERLSAGPGESQRDIHKGLNDAGFPIHQNAWTGRAESGREG